MFKYEAIRTRLKSRQSFINSSTELKDPPDQARLLRWRAEAELDDLIQPNQHLPPGKDLQWELWKTINKLRTGVARTRSNMVKWSLNNKENDKCECGERQTDETLTQLYHENPTRCTKDDLPQMKKNAIDIGYTLHIGCNIRFDKVTDH